ncbi:MAG TPA: hypothetical protein VHP14_12110 [Anaerolineales bacterium]|nr:hypothetical protein [Anaerolineales bacterium]
MNKSSKQKKRSVAQALGYSLLLVMLIGGTGTFFVYLPDSQTAPVPGLITVWALSFTIGIAGFWNARSSHWMAVFILSFSLTTLFLAAAVHMLNPYLSGWLWRALLAGAYLFVWALPLLNPNLAQALNDEQVHPKTWWGRHQVLIFFLLATLGAVLLGAFGEKRAVPINPVMLFLGTMSSILAVGGGQYFAHQVRKSWERRTRGSAR